MIEKIELDFPSQSHYSPGQLERMKMDIAVLTNKINEVIDNLNSKEEQK